MLGRICRKIKTLLFKIFNPSFKKAVLYEVPKVYFKKRLILGNRVHINDNVFINAVGNITVGDYSVLSHGVSLISTMNDVEMWRKKKNDEEIHINKPIIIGKNVWLCANVTVCCGVSIAKDSIVGAGSVVIEEVPPNCTVVGVPGRIVRMGDQKVPSADLDQIHLPDPVLNDIRQLQTDNIRLKKELKALKEKLAKEKIIEEA